MFTYLPGGYTVAEGAEVLDESLGEAIGEEEVDGSVASVVDASEVEVGHDPVVAAPKRLSLHSVSSDAGMLG